MYPITQLLIEATQSETPQQAADFLASKLIGNNPDKNRRLAKNVVFAGHASEGFIPVLASITNLSTAQIKSALQSTATAQSEEDWRERFATLGPHIVIHTRGPVTQATFAALLHRRLRVFRLAPIEPKASLESLLSEAREMIAGLVETTPDTLPIFGKVEGFVFYSHWNLSHYFDRQGHWLRSNFTRGYYGGYVFVSGKAWPTSLIPVIV